MNNNIILEIAKTLNTKEKYVEAVLKLLSEGATIPFIARYRKELTGAMNEEEIRTINEVYEYQVNLLKRKEDVIRLIEEKGLLDDELKVYNTKSIYRLGFHFRSLFIDLANEIIRKSVNRSINKAKVNENNDTTNPHLKRLNTLNDQIKIRQIQLNKLSKTDPNRDSLKNELDNYIRIRDRIKKEHSL